MRALVTGGAGFIGSTLVDRLLDEGHDVDVVDNLSSGSLDNLAYASEFAERFSLAPIDLQSEELVAYVASRCPEVIFHLAAQSSVAVSVQDAMFDAKVNVLGTVHVLEAARVAGTRKIVYAASGGTLYGGSEDTNLPLTEDAPRRQSCPYGASKAAALAYLDCYHDLYGIDFTALALANVYGPRQDPHGEAGVIAIFASRALADLPLTIYGDGHQTRDYVYVSDVVDAFVRASDGDSVGVVNIGTGTETSVLALVDVLGPTIGRPIEVDHQPARPGEVRRCALASTRALSTLGWRATTPLDRGISAVVRSLSEPLAA
jgi:UDP-glucose 4-epimerase